MALMPVKNDLRNPVTALMSLMRIVKIMKRMLLMMIMMMMKKKEKYKVGKTRQLSPQSHGRRMTKRISWIWGLLSWKGTNGWRILLPEEGHGG